MARTTQTEEEVSRALNMLRFSKSLLDYFETIQLKKNQVKQSVAYGKWNDFRSCVSSHVKHESWTDSTHVYCFSAEVARESQLIQYCAMIINHLHSNSAKTAEYRRRHFQIATHMANAQPNNIQRLESALQ